MLCSLGASTRRNWRMGLIISTARGPTTVSPRSLGARREPWNAYWVPPRVTLKWASMILRFGYSPRPASKI